MKKEKVIHKDSAIKRFLQTKETPVFLIVVALCVIMTFLTPNFLTKGNIMTTLLGLSADGIVTIAMTVILALGGIDLSVGSVMCLASMVAAKIGVLTGNLWLGAVLGLLVGALCGVINGLFIAKLKLTPFIMTLAMMSIARGSSMLMSSGKSVAIPKDNAAFMFMGQGYVGGLIPFLVVIFLVIAIVGNFLLRKTETFRKVFYIGSNEKAARLSGINVDRVKLGVYTLSAVLSAFAGVLCVSRFGTATTTTGDGAEMTAISAAVIGGASLDGGSGSILGAVLGILLLNIVDNALVLLHVSVYGQDLISGLILLIAVTMDVFSRRRKTK